MTTRKQTTDIALFIYDCMEKLNIKTLRQLSELSGITQVTIWKLTKGKPVDLNTIACISEALKIQKSAIVDRL